MEKHLAFARPCRARLLPTLMAALLVSACSMMPGKSSQSGGSSGSAPPEPARPAAKSTAGMNTQGEVVDASKVEAGSGTQIKGLNDWEGEITGKPAAGSKFAKLQIGMPLKQATDLVGQPSDQGAYMTGKAWIPFYWGSDRYRHELVYKGQGRLIFAGGSVGDFTSGNLIWIIHSASEPGYRK